MPLTANCTFSLRSSAPASILSCNPLPWVRASTIISSIITIGDERLEDKPTVPLLGGDRGGWGFVGVRCVRGRVRG